MLCAAHSSSDLTGKRPARNPNLFESGAAMLEQNFSKISELCIYFVSDFLIERQPMRT